MPRNTLKTSIEVFDAARHARENFSCGIDSLDEYFRSRASQDRDKHVAAVFVMAAGKTVIGYYTLSAYTIKPGDLPTEIARKLPRYPNLPATLIGRLAVDRTFRGKGYGEELLLDALKRSLDNTAEVGSLAVVVEAENEAAVAFYKKYGFIPFLDTPHKLFLPMKTVRQVFSKQTRGLGTTQKQLHILGGHDAGQSLDRASCVTSPSWRLREKLKNASGF